MYCKKKYRNKGMAVNYVILVVDDQPDTPLLFDQYFKNEIQSGQYIFQYAVSGEKTLELLKEEQSVPVLILILSDIDMDGISGHELLKNIKDAYEDVAVFMITPWGNAQKSQQILEEGAQEIVEKPINFSYLKNLITDAIRLHQIKTGEEG